MIVILCVFVSVCLYICASVSRACSHINKYTQSFARVEFMCVHVFVYLSLSVRESL